MAASGGHWTKGAGGATFVSSSSDPHWSRPGFMGLTKGRMKQLTGDEYSGLSGLQRNWDKLTAADFQAMAADIGARLEEAKRGLAEARKSTIRDYMSKELADAHRRDLTQRKRTIANLQAWLVMLRKGQNGR